MNKDELLEQINTDRRQLGRYFLYFEKNDNGEFVPSNRLKLDREKMLQPGVTDELSVKDIINLLSGWESYFVEWYNHVRFGMRLIEFPTDISWDDKERIDQAILAAKKDLSLADSLAEFRISFQQILKIIELLPEDELTSRSNFLGSGDRSLLDLISEVTWEHYRWAKGHIRIWSRRGGQRGMDKEGILLRIQTERRWLEKNLASLNDKEMIEPGVTGDWSVKDILAHLVDWEQRFLGWYQAGLRGEIPQTPAPGITWKELDKLNQMIFAQYENQPLAEVKAEFQASYQQVLQTVKAIAHDDIFPVGRFAWTGKSNLAAYILANTTNHYRWAKTQIRRWMHTRG